MLNTVMKQDFEHLFSLLMEGRMDLMHLPSGVVAWLWQYHRPQPQIDAASMFGALAHQSADPVIHGALLRADRNVLVLHTESGLRISVYPDGGMGSEGEPLDRVAIETLFSHDTGNVSPVEVPPISDQEIVDLPI